MIAYTCDTTDPAKEAAHLRFSAEILPKMEELEVELARRLLASGYTRAGLEVTIARFRTGGRAIPGGERPAQYRDRGAQRPLPEDHRRADRDVGRRRKDAPGAAALPPGHGPHGPRAGLPAKLCAKYAGCRDELADIFDTLFDLRVQTARNAGFADYRVLRVPCQMPVSTTPRRTAAVSTRPSRRSSRPRSSGSWPDAEAVSGCGTLRPWDTGPDPEGREPLRPFREAEELI